MSRTVDERVVEMRFDNKQFEQNAKTTMNTLERLKAALGFTKSTEALKDLNKVATDIPLNNIAESLSNLEKRFSLFGIVGMRVIENVTDGLMNSLGKGINYVTDAIVSGGIKRAMNIENAHFQLQALLKDESKVQAVMADAMESVDGTAYAYDEAAKAASQFAASGLQAGEEMLGALKGITGVAAMTNSSFEDISRIFTTVAGNGRLMGDQLLQLSGRGLNAASTLADYFKQVRGEAGMTEGTIREMVSDGKISFKDFSDAMTWAFGDSAKRANETFTGALSNMRSALARIGAGFISPLVEQNGVMVKLFNALRIQINNVKSALVFDEQKSAISGLSKVARMTTDELEGMFSTIKSQGHVSTQNLKDLQSTGVGALTALTKYINGVNTGSIRASYATTTALKEIAKEALLTDDAIREAVESGEKDIEELASTYELTGETISKFVEDGRIDLATFTSAMEEEYGDMRALSKQFTDFFQDNMDKLVDFINGLDLTKPMALMYYGVESVKNVFKGLWSVIKPIGKAFAEVFLNFSPDIFFDMAEAVEAFTSNLRFSERGMENVHDLFKGLFDVANLLVSAIMGVVGAFIQLRAPSTGISEVIFEIIGTFGRALSIFAQFVRESKFVRMAFDAISIAIQEVQKWLDVGIGILQGWINQFYELDMPQKMLQGLIDIFEELGRRAQPYIDQMVESAGKLRDRLMEIIPPKLKKLSDDLSDSFSKLWDELIHFNLQTPIRWFNKLKEAIQGLLDIVKGNEGFMTFVTNMKNFFLTLKDAFSFENIIDKITNFKKFVDGFVTWIRENLLPTFGDFNIGSAVAGGAGLGIIYSMVKMAKAIESLAGSVKQFPDFLGSLGGALKAYQKNLKADAIMKIAIAIGVLVGALILLSFADTKKIMEAAIALGVIGGVFLKSVTALMNAFNRGKTAEAAMFQFAKGMKSAIKNVGKAIKINALGKAIKNFAISVAIIAGSLVVLALMYRGDKESLMGAVKILGVIAAVMIGLMIGMTALGQYMSSGMKSFAMAAFGILSLSLAIGIAISALKKLMSMEFPDDADRKIMTLITLFGALGLLAIAMGAAANLTGGNRLGGASTILAMTAMLYVTVLALDKLLKMEFPSDWGVKVAILAGIFVALAGVMIAIGYASKLAGGKMKAAGAILSMCVFLVVVVGALMVLSIIPGDKLLKGAVALGGILLTLAAALYAAGNVTEPSVNKAIMAMAVTVGAVTVALAVLATIPLDKLAKAGVTLGAMLLALALNFKYVGSIDNDKAWINILAMIGAIVVIAGSLYILAEQPWEQMLASGAALSAVILSFAQTMKMVSKMSGLKPEKIGMFLLATLAFVPIGVALYALAEQPWANMLASGVALSATILAFSYTMKTISSARGIKLEKIALFLAATLAVLPIGLAIYTLADQPWANLLAAAGSLSLALVAFSVSFGIISKANPDLTAIGAFLAGTAGVALIAYSLYQLADKPWEALIGAAAAIAIVLGGMTVAMAVCAAIGKVAGSAMQGMLALDAFIANFALIMVALGAIFDDPNMQNLLGGGASVLAQIGNAIGAFAGNIIGGFLEGVTSSFEQIGKDLAAFMTAAEPFFEGSKSIDAQAMEGVKSLASAILTLTGAGILEGLTSWLTGGSSLVSFGEEIAEFAPYFKTYADCMQGVDSSVVATSASAVKILADMADHLPNSGGLAEKIFGDNTLSAFGEELTKFGPHLRLYALQIQGIDPAVVQASANAAQMMADMASTLPKSGGLAAKIFGGNTLSKFGEELEAFGPHIAKYAQDVQGIDPAVVQASVNAASALSALAEGLPNSGGFIAAIVGDNTMDEFGKQLAAFGESFSMYYASIQGIDAEQMNGVMTQLVRLVALAGTMSELDTSGMTGFSEGMRVLGETGITSFLTVFEQCNEKVKTTVSTFLTAVTNEINNQIPNVSIASALFGGTVSTQIKNGMTNKQGEVFDSSRNISTGIGKSLRESLPVKDINALGNTTVDELSSGIEKGKGKALQSVTVLGTDVGTRMKTGVTPQQFNTLAQQVLQGFIDGMNTKKILLLNQVSALCLAVIAKFKLGLPASTFRSLGDSVVTALGQGITSAKPKAINAATDVCNAVVKAFRDNMKESTFREIGANAALGLKNGIESKINEIRDAAIRAARKAIEAAKKELRERSPSRVFFEIGEYASIGLANGMIDQISSIDAAGHRMGQAAIQSLNSTISAIHDAIEYGDIDTELTIRPVVDLSNVQRSADDIATIFNRKFDITPAYNAVLDTASMVEAHQIRQKETSADISKSEPSVVNNYNLEQNNYSPKALNRTEIYRQTKNLFATTRNVVDMA